MVADEFEDAPRYTGGGQIKTIPGFPEVVNGFEVAILTDADISRTDYDELEFTDRGPCDPPGLVWHYVKGDPPGFQRPLDQVSSSVRRDDLCPIEDGRPEGDGQAQAEHPPKSDDEVTG